MSSSSNRKNSYETIAGWKCAEASNRPVGKYRPVLMSDDDCYGCEGTTNSLSARVDALETKNDMIKSELHDMEKMNRFRDSRMVALEAGICRLEDGIRQGVSAGTVKESCVQLKMSIREWTRRAHGVVIAAFVATAEGRKLLTILDDDARTYANEPMFVNQFKTFIVDAIGAIDSIPFLDKIDEIALACGLTKSRNRLFSKYNESIGNPSAHNNPLPLEYLTKHASRILTAAGEASQVDLVLKVLTAVQSIGIPVEKLLIFMHLKLIFPCLFSALFILMD